MSKLGELSKSRGVSGIDRSKMTSVFSTASKLGVTSLGLSLNKSTGRAGEGRTSKRGCTRLSGFQSNLGSAMDDTTLVQKKFESILAKQLGLAEKAHRQELKNVEAVAVQDAA